MLTEITISLRYALI
jgi:serine/threonine protein kinase